MTCANCGSATAGAFCAACGQRSDTRRLALRELFGRVVGELTGYEAPLWRTVRGLAVRPGAVASDYVAGQRTRFVNPIKWAIVTTALYFLASRLLGVEGGMHFSVDSAEAPRWQKTLFDVLSSNAAPLFVLMMLPFLATAMRWCFRGSGRNVAEELCLVLYVYGFAALLQIVYVGFVAWAGAPPQAGGILAPLWLAWAAIRFHPQRRPWASVVLALLANVVWILLLGIVVVAVAGLVALAVQLFGSSAPQDPVPTHEPFAITSRALGEERSILVHLPSGYATDTNQRYPVLYMPDGGLDEDFPHVTATIEALVAAGDVPPLLIVGIPNTQRRRDLTGPTEVESDRKIAPRVGGSAAFRAFVRDELIPEIERRYRCNGDRALVGESLAGLFVVETMLREPQLFDRCIAISPSLWWNEHRLVGEAPALLAAFDRKPRRLYLTAADEADIATHAAELARLLKEHAPPSLNWVHEPKPDLQHSTIFRAVEAAAYRWAFAR